MGYLLPLFDFYYLGDLLAHCDDFNLSYGFEPAKQVLNLVYDEAHHPLILRN
jgi:hypothetical protein